MLQLIDLLQSGRTFNTRELAELSRISRRQVFRDLKALQDSGIPLLFDQQRQGYWLSAETYLPPTDLTLDETLSLLVLAHNLGRAGEGIPFQSAARSAAVKLTSNLPGRLRAHLGDMAAAIDVRLDSHHPHAANLPAYEQLLESIRVRRRIRIRYDSLFEGSELTTLLSPYRLFFRRRAWYVVGRSSIHRAVRTFHVGRIRTTEPTTDAYTIPPRFSVDRYLGNAWHLVREPNRRSRVVVRFQPKVAHNVAEVTWHKTQSLSWNPDGTLDFRVTVDGLSEISWWILGYGDQAEVLEPAELRTAIAGHAARLAALYNGPTADRPKRPRATAPAGNGRKPGRSKTNRQA
ncbi:MAG: WYL domain-containing protein [Planctomycetaceae bacterium]|nr:WYL domain-containing protein [Planctomycetaceae bacterium]